MDYKNFIEQAKEEVGKRAGVNAEEVYVVWYSKTLQHAKALLSANRPDGLYFEATLNGDKNEFYLDTYRKVDNQAIKLGGVE